MPKSVRGVTRNHRLVLPLISHCTFFRIDKCSISNIYFGSFSAFFHLQQLSQSFAASLWDVCGQQVGCLTRRTTCGFCSRFKASLPPSPWRPARYFWPLSSDRAASESSIHFHSFSITALFIFRVMGFCWSPSQLPLGERWDTPQTVHQSITDITYRTFNTIS